MGIQKFLQSFAVLHNNILALPASRRAAALQIFCLPLPFGYFVSRFSAYMPVFKISGSILAITAVLQNLIYHLRAKMLLFIGKRRLHFEKKYDSLTQ